MKKKPNLYIAIFLFLVISVLKIFYKVSDNISNAVYLICFLLSAVTVFFKALKNIIKEKELFSEELLMGLASMAALFLKNFTEAAAVMIFYSLGELIADYSTKRGRKNIISLLNLHPDLQNKITKEGVKVVSASEVCVGDVLFLKKGQMVAFDSTIENGEGFFDTSSITGEAEPRFFKKGDTLLSGYIFCGENMIIRAEKKSDESTAAKILKLVEKAEKEKGSHERFIDKFSSIYTPVVLSLAVLFAGLAPYILNMNFSKSVYIAASFLVASCPCALVISVPLAYFMTISKLAVLKVFVRSANILDCLISADKFYFDKTGTLTDAKFKIKSFKTSLDEDVFKKIVASGEYNSNHPIAKCITDSWSSYIDLSCISSFREIISKGIDFEYENKAYSIRSAKDENQDYEGFKNSIVLSCDNEICGQIFIEDSLREGAEELVSYLRNEGRQIGILTGDREYNARAVARSLDVDEFYFEQLPQDKLFILENDIKRGKVCVFAGDGLNDIACIKRADVGIAMGGLAQDVVREASDIILESESLFGIKSAFIAARKARRTAVLNIVFSLSLKVLIIAFSALFSSPLWLSVLADSGVLLLCVFNSLSLRYRIKK